MIEKIKGLSIKGRCFPTVTQLKFFQAPDERISIIYGKNGSGKSTISEGVRSLTLASEVVDIQASLTDASNATVALDKATDNIFVFNESYIDQNVKINGDGLETIVLLGGQVDIQSEIEKLEQLNTEAQKHLLKLKSASEQYSKSDNPVSPSYHRSRIINILKQTGGWAEIDSKIKSSRRNSSVTDDIVREICTLSPTTTLQDLQKKFKQTQQLLEKISDPSITYPTAVTPIALQYNIENHICELLKKQIEKPVLTEREQSILSVVQSGRQTDIESARIDFSNPQTKICPYCYQQVDEAYKHELINSINRVLNKDVDAHKEDLSSHAISDVKIDIDSYASLDSVLVIQVRTMIVECNDIIKKYNALLGEKRMNIYTPIDINYLGLKEAVFQLNQSLAKLENKRQEFNDAAKESANLRKELIGINKLIAHFYVVHPYKDYIKQLKAANAAKEEYLTQENKAVKISEQLKEMQQRKANTKLAIKSINNALDYVFFMHGRLSIELRNDKYYLKSNGQNVRPKNVSLGERNIIALCYFFTQIMANQEISKLYKSEELVVIDDPVSSFDFENKVGILSFMRYQISRIITGNNNSKVIILSHDLSAAFDLQKAVEEICKATKGNAKISNTDFSWLELSEGNLKRFTKTRSEYATLLKLVYDYADSNTDMGDINIGNTMRRSLEAFSTFTYRKSINDVSCDINILKALGEQSTYFENLMYRLVLHNESHFEEQVYNLHDDANFYNFISASEKQRTAKDVLSFIYLLNPNHITAYLGDVSHAIDKIKAWCKAIPENASFEINENALAEVVSPSSTKMIPLYDFPLSAGTGNFVDENIEPENMIETDNLTSDFALKIQGESMEPNYQDGDIVLIKKCDVISEGQVGAFYYEGRVYCKELRYIGGRTILHSLNPDVEDVEVLEETYPELYGQVIGKFASK